jgi:hypothetical protein
MTSFQPPTRKTPLRHRLERVALALVVCVPVPAFALSGLALPLPGVVERVAAALVPWADALGIGPQELTVETTGGSIVRGPERASHVDSTPPTLKPTRVRAMPRRTQPVVAARPTTTYKTGGQEASDRVPAAPTEHYTDERVGETGAPAPEPRPADPAPTPATPGNTGGSPTDTSPTKPEPTKPASPPVDETPEPEPTRDPEPTQETSEQAPANPPAQQPTTPSPPPAEENEPAPADPPQPGSDNPVGDLVDGVVDDVVDLVDTLLPGLGGRK